jgi:hypothetical protein
VIARVLLLVIAVAACPGPRKVTVDPGQVITLGDTVLRTRDGDVIDVAATRDAAGHEKIGTAQLVGVALEEAKTSPLLGVAAARAWLAVVAEVAATDPEAAYRAGLRGIEELGTGYRSRGSRHVMDDTGNDLRFAKSDADAGDFGAAAERVRGVLNERVEIYLRVYGDRVR